MIKGPINSFLNEMKERRLLFPDAPLNYNSRFDIDQSNSMFLLSHIPKAIFAPSMLKIIDIIKSNY